MEMEFTHGIDRNLRVTQDLVEFSPKGVLGIGTGTESFYIKDIISVSVQECSFVNSGYIQFSIPGTKEENNRVIFGGWSNRGKMNSDAQAIREFVMERMKKLKA
jgi:hypothetical protein